MENEWGADDQRKLECVHAGPYEIRIGDRVRLCPTRRADVLDIALRGRLATVEAIELDLDGRCHLALVVDDDPGAELGFARQIGHRFFFSLDEVAPINTVDARSTDETEA